MLNYTESESHRTSLQFDSYFMLGPRCILKDYLVLLAIIIGQQHFDSKLAVTKLFMLPIDYQFFQIETMDQQA